MAASFAEFEEDFFGITREIVLCALATTDTRGRPRSRMVHPIWQMRDGLPVGYIVTSQTPVKTAHLAANPYVSCTYWSPEQHLVYADCLARWIEDLVEKQSVWTLFTTTPPPVGYELEGFGPEGIRHPLFNPLRLDPWRVQVLRFAGWDSTLTPRMWRADG